MGREMPRRSYIGNERTASDQILFSMARAEIARNL
jgi:hypothetical protein